MPKSRKRKPLVMLSPLILATALAGCITPTNSSATNRTVTNGVACGAFSPITWSSKDTAETVLQIKQHNAAWIALCRK